MARVRSIHPSATHDEEVASMTLYARLAWAYLPCHADREGRMKDSPFALKLAILPTDDVDMNAILNELEDRRHIVRYLVNGRRYIQIRSFAKYQNPHVREVASDIPPVPASGEAQPRQCLAPGKAVASPAVPDLIPDPDPDPSPDPEKAPPAIPGGTWTAWDWFRRFGSAWAQKYKTLTYGQGDGDSKAIGNLGYILAAMPMDERVAVQLLATEMIAEYLSDESPGRVNARHPWKWFVEGFNGFRVPKVKVEQARPAGSLSSYCNYHRDARNNNRPSKYPKPGCPECKHCTASNGTRVGSVYVEEDPYVEALRRKHGRLGQDNSNGQATAGSADGRDAGADAGERGAG